jgi:hypothetical protein
MADEFWLDPSAANGGTGTFGSPFNTMSAAMTATVNAETKLHVKRGLVIAPASRFVCAAISKRPAGYLSIDTYGDADLPPTYFGGTWEAPGAATTGWTYIGGGIWKKAYASVGSNVTVKRVYVGAGVTGLAANNALGTGYKVGYAIARTPVAYNATEATLLTLLGTPGAKGLRLWGHINQPSGFLYIYTPGNSTLPPPVFYQGLAIVGGDNSTFGSAEGLQIADSANITVDGLRVIATPENAFNIRTFNVGLDSDLVTLRNASTEMVAGITYALRGQGTSFVRRTRVEACVADATATVEEDWNFNSAANTDWINGTQDLFRVQHNVSGAVFSRCTALDGYHCGFSIDTSSGTIATADNILFQDCTSDTSNRLYGHPIAAGGTGVNCVFDRITATNSTQFCQLSGKAAVRNSIFYGGKQPYPGYQGQGSVNAEGCVYIATFAPWTTLSAGDITLDNLTLVNPYGYALQFFSTASGSIANGAVTMRNCIVVDTQYLNAGSRTRSTQQASAAGTSILYALNTGESIPTTNLVNNYWYTGTTGQPIVAIQTGSTPSSSTLAALSGASGNSEADPQLTADFRLKSTSPCIGTATPLRVERDLVGYWRPQTPSHGAYEYQA